MEQGNHTEGWTISIGTAPGYLQQDAQSIGTCEFAELYRSCAEQVFQETGTYISAVVQEARMLYKDEWGCPVGGEPGFTLRGTRNPAFSEKQSYHDALVQLTRLLKKKLKQYTVYLEIYPVDLIYINYREACDGDE